MQTPVIYDFYYQVVFFKISALKCGFTVNFQMKMEINIKLDLILIVLLKNYCKGENPVCYILKEKERGRAGLNCSLQLL